MILEYVESIYKDDLEQFLEVVDEEVEKRLESYNTPTLPESVYKALYYGILWEIKYKSLTIPEGAVEVVDENKAKINYDVLTTYLIKHLCIVSFNKILYIYKDGCYKENKGEIEKAIEKILLHEGIADKKKIREITNEILYRITIRTFFREYPFNKLGNKLIPLENGVLFRGEDYIMLPHSPAFGFTYRLPVKYNPAAKCPKIEKFFSEIVDKDNIQILYEIPASCLLQNEEFHYAYMLVGSGRNGKSTYLKLIERFLGEENVSNVSLQELCEDRFKAAQLVGKLANIYADIPRRPIKYTGKFKILTGGDRVTVERKYKDPFEFRNRARLIFSANELPEVDDKTYAFWSRWIVVEFPNTFAQNPDLINEITTEEELSGFLNKVLEAMTRIEIRGDLTKTSTVEKIMEEWMKRVNSVYAFVVDCIEIDPDGFETKDDVYRAYVEYCDGRNYTVLSKNVFSRELLRHVKGLRTGKRKVGGERVYVWLGIKLKRDVFAEEETEEEEKSLEDYDQDWSLESLLGG